MNTDQQLVRNLMESTSEEIVQLPPPKLIDADDEDVTNFLLALRPQYERLLSTKKGVRLSVMHAFYVHNRLVATLGERAMKDVVCNDPNWNHHGKRAAKFTKEHLGQYYKELEGIGIVGLTKSRPGRKISPIFVVLESSPLRKVINANFEEQVRRAWEFATPHLEDVRLPDIMEKYSLVPIQGELHVQVTGHKNAHNYAETKEHIWCNKDEVLHEQDKEIELETEEVLQVRMNQTQPNSFRLGQMPILWSLK
jgi:hypothetical protein